MVVPYFDCITRNRSYDLYSTREVDRFRFGLRTSRIADTELHRGFVVYAEFVGGHWGNVAKFLFFISPFCDNENWLRRFIHHLERRIEERRDRQYNQDPEKDYGCYGQNVEGAPNHLDT